MGAGEADGGAIHDTTETRTGPREHPSLPLPRLQLRWALDDPSDPDAATCHYELAFGLGATDRRSGLASGEGQHTIKLGETRTRSGRDWSRPAAELRPVADGAHAKWDSAALGGLPVYVIKPDGTAGRYWPERQEAPMAPAEAVPANLSHRQIEALRHGRDKGGGIFVPGSNAGGAIYRMCERLARMGLLERSPPFPVTDAGREALAKRGI